MGAKANFILNVVLLLIVFVTLTQQVFSGISEQIFRLELVALVGLLVVAVVACGISIINKENGLLQFTFAVALVNSVVLSVFAGAVSYIGPFAALLGIVAQMERKTYIEPALENTHTQDVLPAKVPEPIVKTVHKGLQPAKRTLRKKTKNRKPRKKKAAKKTRKKKKQR